MKYIRTSDGHIYETTGQDKKHPCYYNIANANLEIDALGIINQSDTIEELCDEIVEVIDGKAQVVYADISFNDLAIAKIRDKNNAIVYGAIWTDKGLIYVAKMNDKGELELL